MGAYSTHLALIQGFSRIKNPLVRYTVSNLPAALLTSSTAAHIHISAMILSLLDVMINNS